MTVLMDWSFCQSGLRAAVSGSDSGFVSTYFTMFHGALAAEWCAGLPLVFSYHGPVSEIEPVSHVRTTIRAQSNTLILP
jgi:hypothetical protein